MKRIPISVMASIVVTLYGCSNSVPEVPDPDNIVVNGKKMTQAEFLEMYCLGQSRNETCIKVLIAKRKNHTRGPMPNW